MEEREKNLTERAIAHIAHEPQEMREAEKRGIKEKDWEYGLAVRPADVKKIDLKSGEFQSKKIWFFGESEKRVPEKDKVPTSVPLIFARNNVDLNSKTKNENAWICTLDGLVLAECVSESVVSARRDPNDRHRKIGAFHLKTTNTNCSMLLDDHTRFEDIVTCEGWDLSYFLSDLAAANPSLCGYIPSGVYQALPKLSQEILIKYQNRVLSENSAMEVGKDRRPFVEKVRNKLQK